MTVLAEASLSKVYMRRIPWSLIVEHNIKRKVISSEFLTLFFVIKPTRCTNFTNLFCYKTLHVSHSSSVHHQRVYSLCTQQWYMSYIFWAGPEWNWVPSWFCSKAVYKPVWHIPLLSVQRINSWWWTDKLFNTCAVSCQNKFVKLAHLVGFIINKFITMHGHTNVKEREMSSYDNIHFPWLSCVVNAKILRVIQTNLWPPSNTAKSVK